MQVAAKHLFKDQRVEADIFSFMLKAIMFFNNFEPEEKIYQRIGWLVAIIWIISALPDLVNTFLGNRTGNDSSITPVWIKAIRDIFTLGIALYLSRELDRRNLLWRLFAVVFFMAYVIYGILNEFPVSVSFRGTLWILALCWCATANAVGSKRLYVMAQGIFNITLPAAISISLVLGLLGAGMYFEGVGPYERNPGLFLTPSATAFMACLIFLLSPEKNKKNAYQAFAMGTLTLSGIFFINAALVFGRLNRKIYIIGIGAIAAILLAIGIDGIIQAVSLVAGFLRSSEAVTLTLGTRVLIVLETIRKLSFFGSYPVGLNIAANQDIDVFFPDNAYLSLTYAYGAFGIALSFAITFFAFRARNFGFFILILTASLFYVWFENLLFCVLIGLALNKNVNDVMSYDEMRKI